MCFEIEVFGQEKGHIYGSYISGFRGIETKGRKNRVDD